MREVNGNGWRRKILAWEKAQRLRGRLVRYTPPKGAAAKRLPVEPLFAYVVGVQRVNGGWPRVILGFGLRQTLGRAEFYEHKVAVPVSCVEEVA